MRLYANCMEMYNETKRDLHEMGVLVHPQTMQDKNVAADPSFQTLELSPCAFSIIDGSDRNAWLKSIGKNLAWCEAEFEERWRPALGRDAVNPGQAWELRADVWREFLHDGKFAYTYSQRFGEVIYDMLGHDFCTAIQRVAGELSDRPDTRQAVLPVFSAIRDLPNLGGAARVPCSMHYQFLRRRGELDLIYVMRSSDFYTHFPYDIWLAIELQHAMSEAIGAKRGRFSFFSGSLHIYRKDAEEGVF